MNIFNVDSSRSVRLERQRGRHWGSSLSGLSVSYYSKFKDSIVYCFLAIHVFFTRCFDRTIVGDFASKVGYLGFALIFVLDPINNFFEKMKSISLDLALGIKDNFKKLHVKRVLQEEYRNDIEAKKKLLNKSYSPMDKNTLSFADKFYVLSGVPVIPITHPDNINKTFQNANLLNTDYDGSIKTTCSDFSYDGSYLATGHSDNSVCIWDVSNGKLMNKLNQHENAPCEIKFAIDGKNTLVSVDRKARVVVWDLENAKQPNAVSISDCSLAWEEDEIKIEQIIHVVISNSGRRVLFAIKTCVMNSTNARASQTAAFFKANARVGPSLEVCKVFIFDVTHLETNLTVPQPPYIYRPIPIRELSIELRDDTPDYDISFCQFSPSGNGLLIGYNDRPNGYVAVWPDYIQLEHESYCLMGTVGKWSWDQKNIVTWDIPIDSSPRKDYGVCYVWDVKKIKDSKRIYQEEGHPRKKVKKQTVIRDPKNDKIYWCDFIQQMKGIERGVATCSISLYIKLILWDIDACVPVHVINTDILATDVVIADREPWDNVCIHCQKQWGLNAITMSKNGRWLGYYSSRAQKGAIVDAQLGIKVLEINIGNSKDEHIISMIQNPMCLLFSEKGNKFILCDGVSMFIWSPRVLNRREHRGAHVISLQSSDKMIGNGISLCHFSPNGERVGLLRPYSAIMCIFDLMNGECFNLAKAPAKVTDVQLGSLKLLQDYERNSERRYKFCNFGFSKDGTRIVTCMADMAVLLWELDSERCLNPENFIRKPIKRLGNLNSTYNPAWAVCFSRTPDRDETVVICEDTGHLVWIDVARTQIVDRINALGTRSCKFSGDGTTAVLSQNSQCFYVWDLINRQKTHVFRYMVGIDLRNEVNSNGRFSFIGIKKYTSASDSLQPVLVEPYQKLEIEMDTCKFYIPYNKAISDDANFVVYDCLNETKSLDSKKLNFEAQLMHSKRKSKKFPKISYNADQSMPLINMESMSDSEIVSLEEECMKSHDKLTVVRVEDNNIKELYGEQLQPDKFISISSNGRKIACLGQKNQLIVWDAYATDGCIPMLQYLNLGNLDQCDKEACKDYLKDVFDRFGPSVLNYPNESGLTILLNAVFNTDIELVNFIFNWAKNNDVEVTLSRKVKFPGDDKAVVTNALDIAVRVRSPELVKIILENLLNGSTSLISASLIYRKSLVQLASVYPHLFCENMTEDRMMLRLPNNLSVPEWTFENSRFKVLTSEHLFPPYSELNKMWNEKVRAEITKAAIFGGQLTTSKTEACAEVIPYPDIARIGSNGILRQLVLNNTPPEIYESLPIQCVIKYKWGLYAERLVKEDFWFYTVLIILFTIYAFLSGFHGTDDVRRISKMFKGEGNALSFFLLTFITLCCVMGFGKLTALYKQLYTLWKDARYKGLLYWGSNLKNWVEFMAYTILVFVIPLLHLRGWSSALLTTFIALESLLLWFKLIYYAAASKRTGPMFLNLAGIVRDMRPFLALLFAIVFGFALAFFIIYRELRLNECDDMNTNDPNDADAEYILNYSPENRDAMDCLDNRTLAIKLYGDPLKSFITMFSMMLSEVGDANEGLYLFGHVGLKMAAIIFYFVYLVIVAIVLLNLLIALMGDSFDRIKDTEAMEFLKQRAQVIDDVEAMLSERKKREIGKKIHQFLHVLLPAYEVKFMKRKWEGRVREMETRINQIVTTENEKLQEELKDIQDSQKELHLKLDKLSKVHLPEDNIGGESSQRRFMKTQSSRFTYELRPVVEETESEETESEPDTPYATGPERDDTTYGQ